MKIILLRHFESEKNINTSFSSTENDELLTEQGIKMGEFIAENINDYVIHNHHVVHSVYCADSKRAVHSAEIIASQLNVDVRSFKDLTSNNSGQLLGKTEYEAMQINPEFMYQLKLYRAGLYSSYDFVKVYERENKKDFENRVNMCVSNILLDKTETLKIIVMHHSSLTAFMINFARKYYNYPINFYGHVDCSLGNIYLLDNNKIILCNESSKNLI